VIVSSYAPSEICLELAEAITQRHNGIDAKAGQLHVSPKAMGAASLPFSSKFMVG